MRRILLVLMMIFLGTLNIHEAQAETDSVIRGNYEFEYESTKGGVWITKVTPLSNKGIATLKIPAKIKGKKVVKFGTKKRKTPEWQVEDYEENVFGVSLAPDDAGYPCEPMDIYERTKKIEKIQIPETVKEITGMAFIRLQNGKSINIPKDVVKNVTWLTYYKWKKFKISSKNKKYKNVNGCLLSKDGKIVYGLVEKRDKVVIPKTVRQMKIGEVTAYDGASVIVLPKGLRKIEDDGFQISSKVTIKVAKGNKKYAAKYGCLYNKKTGRLVAACAPDGVFHIPEGVTYVTTYYIKSGIIIDDTGIHEFGGVASKMIVPESMKEIESILEFSTTEEFTCVMKGKIPPKLTCMISNYVKKLTVYVPKGSKSSYELEWGKAFKYCKSLTVTYIEQE